MTSTDRVGNSGNTTGAGSKDPIAESQANAAEYKKALGDADQTGANDQAYYLKLQRAMLQEQQAYQAVSTIMNIRAKMADTALQNSRTR